MDEQYIRFIDHCCKRKLDRLPYVSVPFINFPSKFIVLLKVFREVYSISKVIEFLSGIVSYRALRFSLFKECNCCSQISLRYKKVTFCHKIKFSLFYYLILLFREKKEQ